LTQPAVQGVFQSRILLGELIEHGSDLVLFFMGRAPEPQSGCLQELPDLARRELWIKILHRQLRRKRPRIVAELVEQSSQARTQRITHTSIRQTRRPDDSRLYLAQAQQPFDPAALQG